MTVPRSIRVGSHPVRRRATRIGGRMKVMVLTMKGPIPGNIVDLSLTGCCIECAVLPPMCLMANLLIGEDGLQIKAQRRWVSQKLSGWKFVFAPQEIVRLHEIIEQNAYHLSGDGD
ncbi:hypothetical protein HDIA_2200 [Hartmannibacter diazotrophicus]|uniref:PilZ domain-containing protein n=1 Tax=Hartmannibacter diazotrophicus TaxID=1482074 RepID=A0A2C9D7L5_9HYPH|nr:PilZ domain-containing protein [Hartmannibacter diazotrophicus]SON55741.1 hypothetical protein HDIA_2200 [Hartmannibacter diazotrophicus]